MTKTIMAAFALAALAMTINGAFAATTINNTKSNTSYKANCVKDGGTVGKNSKGQETCTTPDKKKK